MPFAQDGECAFPYAGLLFLVNLMHGTPERRMLRDFDNCGRDEKQVLEQTVMRASCNCFFSCEISMLNEKKVIVRTGQRIVKPSCILKCQNTKQSARLTDSNVLIHHLTLLDSFFAFVLILNGNSFQF